MRATIKEAYVCFLWLLCGCALYSLFRSWWPWTRAFWDGTWTGGLVIALLAGAIVQPVEHAFRVGMYREDEPTNEEPRGERVLSRIAGTLIEWLLIFGAIVGLAYGLAWLAGTPIHDLTDLACWLVILGLFGVLVYLMVLSEKWLSRRRSHGPTAKISEEPRS